MEVKITLNKNETQEQAEEMLVKAITGKYDTSKKPHPDQVVEEITIQSKHEYNKMLLQMTQEIFEIISVDNKVVL